MGSGQVVSYLSASFAQDLPSAAGSWGRMRNPYVLLLPGRKPSLQLEALHLLYALRSFPEALNYCVLVISPSFTREVICNTPYAVRLQVTRRFIKMIFMQAWVENNRLTMCCVTSSNLPESLNKPIRQELLFLSLQLRFQEAYRGCD